MANTQGGNIKGYDGNDRKFVAEKSSDGLKEEECLLYLECWGLKKGSKENGKINFIFIRDYDRKLSVLSKILHEVAIFDYYAWFFVHICDHLPLIQSCLLSIQCMVQLKTLSVYNT